MIQPFTNVVIHDKLNHTKLEISWCTLRIDQTEFAKGLRRGEPSAAGCRRKGDCTIPFCMRYKRFVIALC